MNSSIAIVSPEKIQGGLRQKVIGITGNPGSGKTSLSLLFKENGATVLNGDELGHAMLQSDSPVYPQLVEAFGSDILDEEQKIDRKKLGNLVFLYPLELQRLNQIVHPTMLHQIRIAIDSFRIAPQNGPFILDAALIFEWNIAAWFDLIMTVAAPLEIRKQRFSAVRGDINNTFANREASQLPETYKTNHADIVIHNIGEWTELRTHIKVLMES